MTSRNDLERLVSTTATTSDPSLFRTAIRNVIASSRSSPLALAAYCKEGAVPALATSLTQVRSSQMGHAWTKARIRPIATAIFP